MNPNSLHKFLAALLTAVFLFPVALESYHSNWHEHEPVDCKVTQTHIHQDQVDCSLNDLQLSPFDYSLFVPEMEQVLPLVTEELSSYDSRIRNTLHHRLRDRGPPRDLQS